MRFWLFIAWSLSSLAETTPNNENVAIILSLKNPLNPSTLAEMKLPLSRRPKAIARAMQAHAEKQLALQFPGLRNNPEVSDVALLWILNSVRVIGKKSAIEKLVSWNSSQYFVEQRKEVSEIFDGLYSSVESPNEIGWGIQSMHAPEVWARGYKGDGVAVAVLDSGATIEHPDLKNSVLKNRGEIEGNGLDDDNNGFIDDILGWNFESNSNNLEDAHGHGTQIAGVIAGSGVKGVQTGVAPKAKLVVIRTCCDSDSRVAESNLWLGIQYALLRNARVISMSLSIKHYSDPAYASWRKVGEVLLAAGVIHVNSAGNRGSGKEPFNIGAPGSNPPAWFHPEQTAGSPSSMVTVGAVDDEHRARNYSATGPVTWEFVPGYRDFPYQQGKKPGLIKPDVCAPSEVPTTHRDGETYALCFGGTSSAAPHVAGTIALLLSARNDLTVEQLTEAIQQSAIRVGDGFNNRCGAGRVDALAALEYIQRFR